MKVKEQKTWVQTRVAGTTEEPFNNFAGFQPQDAVHLLTSVIHP